MKSTTCLYCTCSLFKLKFKLSFNLHVSASRVYILFSFYALSSLLESCCFLLICLLTLCISYISSSSISSVVIVVAYHLIILLSYLLFTSFHPSFRSYVSLLNKGRFFEYILQGVQFLFIKLKQNTRTILNMWWISPHLSPPTT